MLSDPVPTFISAAFKILSFSISALEQNTESQTTRAKRDLSWSSLEMTNFQSMAIWFTTTFHLVQHRFSFKWMVCQHLKPGSFSWMSSFSYKVINLAVLAWVSTWQHLDEKGHGWPPPPFFFLPTFCLSEFNSKYLTWVKLYTIFLFVTDWLTIS